MITYVIAGFHFVLFVGLCYATCALALWIMRKL